MGPRRRRPGQEILRGGITATKEDSGKAPLNQLLQLIVRYEGDGIIDSNVNEFMKLYLKAAAAEVVDPSWPERINAEAKPGKKTSSTWPATTEDQPIPFDPKGKPCASAGTSAVARPSTGGVSSPPVYMPPPPRRGYTGDVPADASLKMPPAD